jgi:hypothetical protein
MGDLCAVNPRSARFAIAFVSAVLALQAGAWATNFGAFPNNSTHSAAAVAEAIANVPLNVGTVYDTDGQTTDDIQIWNFGTEVYTGPVDVTSTLDRIRDGDWMPTETDDGGFFNFDSNELPNIPRMGNDYYMEFVVWPLMDLSAGTYDTTDEAYGSMAYPGSMRLLIGLGGQVYFTGDHYGESGPQQDAYLVNPVPEPTGVAVLGLCTLGLLYRRRRTA